ncbi:glycosyltransferase family 4 protein [Isoptericola sp. b441]|uniref:Glycosyltransferase family 4 protein n=1 Tax=Actinotalea lenta TaxID=3064654 RepID=A0ABT9D4M8_9CELL|nr:MULTISPECIES: glycosyltransferase family 4 protein [unclassified Isoptericola]MDO8105635.1 glycosyltransferase family 4 protein [Isoptericola sp. b441]MDO8122339.1 glycosyltransferase family 4 protein [Isoptericola sp. b490]
MRIVHVSDCYAPRTGGIETQVRDLARAQVRAGHDVHVLTATLGPAGERGGAVTDDEGVTVHRLGARLPFDLPVNPAAVPEMRRLLTAHAPDVVHVHAGVVSPFAYDGARVALDAGVPTAITWHCMLDGAVPALRALAARTRWRRAPVALSAVSAAAAERVAQVFGSEVHVIPNGMDVARWAPDAEPGSGPLRAVATMRLAPRKRGPALVAVLEDVMTQLEPGSLVVDVFGDGPVRERMARSVHRRGLDGVVTLRGGVPRETLRDAYRGAHVFLAPAVLEAFGIAALEARSAGLVVVAHRGTGVAEFVTDGQDGLLVDDDAGMARALVRLVRDPGLLARLQGAARASRPPFTWDLVLDRALVEYARARTLVDR